MYRRTRRARGSHRRRRGVPGGKRGFRVCSWEGWVVPPPRKGASRSLTPCESRGSIPCESRGCTTCESRGSIPCESRGCTPCEHPLWRMHRNRRFAPALQPGPQCNGHDERNCCWRRPCCRWCCSPRSADPRHRAAAWIPPVFDMARRSRTFPFQPSRAVEQLAVGKAPGASAVRWVRRHDPARRAMIPPPFPGTVRTPVVHTV